MRIEVEQSEKRYGPAKGLTLDQIELQCKGYGPGYQFAISSGTAMALVQEIRTLTSKLEKCEQRCSDLGWIAAGDRQ